MSIIHVKLFKSSEKTPSILSVVRRGVGLLVMLVIHFKLFKSGEKTASVLSVVRRGVGLLVMLVIHVKLFTRSEKTVMKIFMRFQRRVFVWLISEINATKANSGIEPRLKTMLANRYFSTYNLIP
jgi:hypothetical protein